MDNISLVTNALEYYDKNIEIYNNLFKDVVYTKNTPPESINGHDIIMFYDKNKKEIFRSRYEILGLHTITSNIWTWGWAVPNLKKNQTNISRKIWMYGSVLDPEISFLKSELITSRFQINSTIQTDIHVGIASYLSKNPLIYKYYVYKNTEVDDNNIRKELNNNYIVIYYLFLLDYKDFEKHINSESSESSKSCDESSDLSEN